MITFGICSLRQVLNSWWITTLLKVMALPLKWLTKKSLKQGCRISLFDNSILFTSPIIGNPVVHSNLDDQNSSSPAIGNPAVVSNFVPIIVVMVDC